MQNWSRLIFEYANYSRETYVCPSAVPENEPFHANSIPDLRIQWRTRAQTIFMGANYTYNTQLNADRHSSFPGLLDGQALTIDHVANTANCPMIEDGLTYPGRQAFEPRAFPDVGPYADESFTWWLNAPAPRHPVENANMVFVDTHVESVPAGVDDLPLPSESYLIWTRWNDIDYQPRGIEFSIP